MQRLGFTRSAHTRNHLLQTPDTFIRAPFPGMVNANAVVHAAPALGASFVEYTAEMNPGGRLAPTALQRFLYVLSGDAELRLGDDASIAPQAIMPGGFAFLPAGVAHTCSSPREACVVVIEKRFEPAPGIPAPPVVVGDTQTVEPHALMGDPGLEVRPLLPDNECFDCAVNLMTFQPGASLPMVEIHVMEHGLMMLEGGGVYRLGDCWYPVCAGDFIWMAAYCPQWFGAIGKRPARYLIYKDFNRAPVA